MSPPAWAIGAPGQALALLPKQQNEGFRHERAGPGRAVGRGDPQGGRRTSPCPASACPVAVVRWLGRDQGRGGARERRPRAARRRPRAADRRRGRRDRRGPARRAVPDRRLPDRLGHVVEHERQRGHRHAGGRGRAPERPREHGPVLQRRVPERRAPGRARRGDEHAAARARAARGGVRRQGRGVQGHRQVRPHAPDGRGAGHARAGVRRLRRADPARPRARRRRAAARRADPARRHRHRHRPEHAPGVRGEGPRALLTRTPASTSARPRTRSRRRATATRWSSCPAR